MLRKYKESRMLCKPQSLKCFHITCHPLKCEVQIRLILQFSPILSVSWESKYSHRRESSEKSSDGREKERKKEAERSSDGREKEKRKKQRGVVMEERRKERKRQRGVVMEERRKKGRSREE